MRLPGTRYRRSSFPRSLPAILIAVIAGQVSTAPLLALDPPKPPTSTLSSGAASLATREWFRPELTLTLGHVPATTGEAAAHLAARGAAWSELVRIAGPKAQIYLDPRSGTPASLMAAIPLVPGDGKGNHLTLDAMGTALGHPAASVDAALVAGAVRGFVSRHAAAIAVDDAQVGAAIASPVTPELWQVRIPQVVDGIPVRFAHLSATISHGNMVLLGTEAWGTVRIDTKPVLTAAQALEAGFAYAGGRTLGDTLWAEPHLEILPYAPPSLQDGGGAFTGPIGEGYGHYLAWVFGFRRDGVAGDWEVLVDAHGGGVLGFEDQNRYEAQQIRGGAYPLTNTGICPDNMTCGTMQPDQPMPYANTGLPAPNNFANSAGVYDYPGGTVTTTLAGKFVRMTDTCGALSESTASGLLDLGGANGQHDCISAGASPGDTPATRSGYYELNKLIEVAKGWLPLNVWLNGQIVSNMNLNATCNAFYQPANGTINFYRSGGGCRNTGEIAAVFDHEWGHALDDHDSGGALSNSSEAYADIAAIYRLRASCVGYGFWQTLDKGCGMTADGTGFNQNESQTGVYCATNCSGVRDSDWTRHVAAAPATPLGFVCSQCLTGSGPCGRQVHCAAAPAREAAWDLVARDLQAPPFSLSREDAFDLGSKVFFQGSGGIGSWNACSCGASSDGCGATNAYPQWLAADDDDGDLTNGTPHMTAIFAAFDRHGIACPTPAPVNSGCAGGPTTPPVATASSHSNNQIDLSWSAVPGAVKYRVLRTEGYAGCDFGKAVIAEAAGTSYTDLEVANDRPYDYVVQPVGASGACMGPVSSCITATPLACAGSLGIDKASYTCSDVIHLNVVDADLAGAGSQTVSVASSVETTPEIVTLLETPAGSGRFSGSIATSSAPPAPDGVLEVAHGGQVTAIYVDASSCGASNVTKQRTASVDCTGQACSGAVGLDRTKYSCTSTLGLSLVDSDLAGRGTQSVSVRSTFEPSPESVTLVESPAGSGRFAGTIPATPALPSHDGRISAADLGVVTLSYTDASACGVPGVAVQKTATFDCAGPVISNVRVEAVTGSTASVRWDTNEPANGFVTYGGAIPPQTTTPVSPALVTAHAIPLTGLTECTRQFFSVGSSDEFSQASVANNSGAFYAFDVGANVPVSVTAADTPVPIPPGGPFVGISRITLSDPRLVADVDVRLDVTHPFDGQTQIFLRHPDGTLISLSNQHGGSGANYTGTVFDDEATTPVSSASPPFTGTFKPDGQLSQLDGKSAQGTWQLEVYDFISGNAGTITGFTLSLQLAQPVCLPGAAESSSLRATDVCAGGGAGSANGYWDDGESAQIQVTLENTGQFDLTGVSASLAPLTAGVVMSDDEASFPDLPRGGRAASAAPHFTAYLPVGFSCATPIRFALTIRTNRGTFTDVVDAGISGRPVGASVATDLFETFGAGIPAAWTIENRGSGGGAASTWTTANPGNRTANSPIAAPFAIVDSQAAGAGATQEERLITPPLNLTGVTHVTLEFDSAFVFAAGGAAERGDVDVISTLTGGTPTNVFRYQSSSANPDHRVLDISSLAAGAPDVQIRFRYSGGPLDNWWILDNVKVTHDVPPSCALVSCPVTTAPSEVLHMSWDGRTTASWTPAAGATSYTLYRGVKADLPGLLSSAADSCARLATAATTATGITETPPPGAFFWWLVRASNANGIGSAGSGSAGPRIQNSTGSCP